MLKRSTYTVTGPNISLIRVYIWRYSNFNLARRTVYRTFSYAEYALQALDKRNQNIIQSILESPSPANVSSAEDKARTFYRETAKCCLFHHAKFNFSNYLFS
jgi:hypothetical protein